MTLVSESRMTFHGLEYYVVWFSEEGREKQGGSCYSMSRPAAERCECAAGIEFLKVRRWKEGDMRFHARTGASSSRARISFLGSRRSSTLSQIPQVRSKPLICDLFIHGEVALFCDMNDV